MDNDGFSWVKILLPALFPRIFYATKLLAIIMVANYLLAMDPTYKHNNNNNTLISLLH